MELLTLLLHNILSFVVIISVIVFIHEFGHYYVAKLCGVKIDAFSIGFGPEIYGWNDKSGTRWKISAFPLGGYVKMFGDESAASTPDNESLKKMSEEEKKVAFHTQSVGKRFAIVAAGPIANYLLAIIILAGFFAYYGRPEATPEIGKIIENSAAQEAGLKVGDVIVELNGSKIERFEQIRGIAAIHPDMEISIKYLRNGEEISTNITPKKSETTDIFGEKVKVGLIGITSGKITHNEMSLPSAIISGVTESYTISVRTLEAIGQMITGRRSAEELSGILRIADYSGKSVERGMETVLWFMAILSINLGLINLFPIPMLDGGHLALYTIEAVRRKPVSEKFQGYLFKFGFSILIFLMIFATFNDLKHFGIF